MKIRNIEAINITEAHFKLLNKIIQEGKFKLGENGENLELFNSLSVAMTISLPKALTLIPNIPATIPCSYEELADYVFDVVEDTRGFEVDYGKWAYTYGGAIKKQIPFVVEELKRCKHSRRAVINVSENKTQLAEPPCLQELIFSVEGNVKLNMSVIFRSNDALKAFPENMVALLYVQAKIANGLNLSVGEIQYYCPNVHIYENDLEKAVEYVNRYNKAVANPKMEGTKKLGIYCDEFEKIKKEREPIYKAWCQERKAELEKTEVPIYLIPLLEFLKENSPPPYYEKYIREMFPKTRNEKFNALTAREKAEHIYQEAKYCCAYCLKQPCGSGATEKRCIEGIMEWLESEDEL